MAVPTVRYAALPLAHVQVRETAQAQFSKTAHAQVSGTFTDSGPVPALVFGAGGGGGDRGLRDARGEGSCMSTDALLVPNLTE